MILGDMMLDGYVPLRRGIGEHLPNMSSAEVKLFVKYLVGADFRTAICKITSEKLAEQIGWSNTNVSHIRQLLIRRRFIVPNKRNSAGVWIPKFDKPRGNGCIAPPEWALEYILEKWPDTSRILEEQRTWRSSRKLEVLLQEYLKIDPSVLQDMLKYYFKNTCRTDYITRCRTRPMSHGRSRSKKLESRRSSRTSIVTSKSKEQISHIKALHEQLEKIITAGLGGIIGHWNNWGLTNAADTAREIGQNPLAEYLDTFRTDRMTEKGRRVETSKELRLLRELLELVGKHKPEIVMQAVQDVNKRKLRRPLKNHNYLKQVILSKEHEAKKKEPPKTTRRKGYYLE